MREERLLQDVGLCPACGTTRWEEQWREKFPDGQATQWRPLRGGCEEHCTLADVEEAADQHLRARVAFREQLDSVELYEADGAVVVMLSVITVGDTRMQLVVQYHHEGDEDHDFHMDVACGHLPNPRRPLDGFVETLISWLDDHGVKQPMEMTGDHAQWVASVEFRTSIWQRG